MRIIDTLIDEFMYLSNDCGGCEDCIRIFSQEMHDDLYNRVNTLLSEEEREYFWLCVGGDI